MVARTSAKFWEGFGYSECPDFRHLSVLEVGCGVGNRTIEIASHHARRVVGLDPSSQSITEARAGLAQAKLDRPELVEFFSGFLDELPPEEFDVVVSEDTLEHVEDVTEFLASVSRRLRKKGRFYLGFGPLYHAPDGDHGWMRAALPGSRYFLLPWGHLLFEKIAFRRLSNRYGRTINQTKKCPWPYLMLNQLTVEDFHRVFGECGLDILYLRTNFVRSFKGRLIALAGRVPKLTRYCTLNMYVVLGKDSLRS